MSEPVALSRLPPGLPEPPGLLGGCRLPPSRVPQFLLPVRATCGFPSPAEDFYGRGNDLELNERVISNSPATFLVEADTGTSMVDFGIFRGDTLVVDRSLTAKFRDIVMLLWDGGYMIKQWCPTARGLQLLSDNSRSKGVPIAEICRTRSPSDRGRS